MEEKLDQKVSKESFIIMCKFLPHFMASIYIIFTLFQFVGIDLVQIGVISHVSLLPWIFLFSASVALEFCYVHRLPLYYIAFNETITVIDYWFNLPISNAKLCMIHLLCIGIVVLLYTSYYVKFNLKRSIEGDK